MLCIFATPMKAQLVNNILNTAQYSWQYLLYYLFVIPISATLCKRAVLTLRQAFLFLGLGCFSAFLAFACWPLLFFSCKKLMTFLT
jgi:hypothetical protein